MGVAIQYCYYTIVFRDVARDVDRELLGNC